MNNNFLNYNDFIKIKKNKYKKYLFQAIIIGGTGRIGSVFTNELLSQNIPVLSLSRSKKNFEIFKASVPKDKKFLLNWHHIDLSNDKTIKVATKYINSKFNMLNYFINAGSISNRGKNIKYNKRKINDEFLRISGGIFILLEGIIELLRNNKNTSKIINVSSFWGKVAPNFKTYLEMDISPSLLASYGKAGMENAIKYLAVREANNNITCNTLMPGWFPRKGPVERKDYMENIFEKVPLNRIGVLEDLIPSVQFLLNKDNNYITGQSIIVDGGYTIW